MSDSRNPGELMENTRRLAIRFDIESTTCLERGVPGLLSLARRFGVKFSFYVNMGKSFNLKENFRSRLRGTKGAAGERVFKLSLKTKLGLVGILKTVFWNPELGKAFLRTLERIRNDGHELALHGGMNHALWQHAVLGMSRHEVAELLLPACRKFEKAFGAPQGFSSPGFQFSACVLDVLDELGFAYSTDMAGETPFRTKFEGKDYRIWQVPVNVIGGSHIPIIEESLAMNCTYDDTCSRVINEIMKREFALLYGHPYVEGIHTDIFEKIFEAVLDKFKIITVSDYLTEWRNANDWMHH